MKFLLKESFLNLVQNLKGNKHYIFILICLISLLIFIIGFVNEVGIGHPILYWLLTTALFLKIVKVLFEWYHYAGVKKNKNPTDPPPQVSYEVDMFTTACPGEPYQMIENTLNAMVRVRYPHETYLCDEGNDPDLRQLCLELGVHYITRNTWENAKAGNINNALAQSKGEICTILDPDHIPSPDYLDQVLHHFQNPDIGFVQVVQAYHNQSESLIARGAAEQTYIFYGPFMRAMGNYGTAQAIGANCTFRRKALDSIGGHAAGLTEDLHTSMLLHAKGWKSVFVPTIVSRGLVPTSLSAYYKQQLKWSRGTFDLWINLFPRIFKDFSMRQKIHYGLLPIYFLFGFITLIDIFVPVYSLATGSYPWLMNPSVFFVYFTPFLLCSLIIRLQAQQWLYSPDERGLHLLGGILRVGTWWVYITGFIYTVFNIKVAYNPTPKTHTSKGEFILGLPNLVIGIICISAAVYGLEKDWQPYSFFMAGFALMNALIFLLAFILSQSTWHQMFNEFWVTYKNSFSSKLRIETSYLKLNRVAVFIIMLLFFVSSFTMILFGFNSAPSNYSKNVGNIGLDKNIGGFYTGVYLPSVDLEKGIEDFIVTENEIEKSWTVSATYLSWNTENLPISLWENIIKHGSIPMITWEPFTDQISLFKDHPDIGNNQKVFLNIIAGCFDAYIDEMGISLRSLDSPVFLRFAHEMDNPMYPWSTSGGNTPEEFKDAWKYIHERFDALGVQNVSWIWSPWSTAAMEEYFPYGKQKAIDHYVDWIGLTVLNYGLASWDQNWRSFHEIYKPFKEQLSALSLNLPIMIAEFGSTSYGGDAALWHKEALIEIKEQHTEIKSAIFFQSEIDKNWITEWRPSDLDHFINWKIDLSTISSILTKFTDPLPNGITYPAQSAPSRSKNISGNYGDFSWMVDGSPFYMQGICYNPGHDWQEGFYPLSRKQLENDFKLIKNMGANTIRRYEPGIYDRNVLKVAEEQGLKVMFGFWFDPEIDYYKNKTAVEAYEEKVLKYVNKHKDHKSIIAWNIGNETWGLQKQHYQKPYLNLTRKAYLQFLENLSQKIHEIDPDRPVFSSEEHDHFRLLSTIYEFGKHAPSIDVLGINSYYKQNIEQVKDMVSQFDTLRPYLLTEFGPKGYWSQEFGDFKYDSLLIEVSSLAKAKWFEKQWNEHIIANKGYNLGGLAFSWRDRYEGTATWFGISDYKGRLKPAYYYLQRAWTGKVIKENEFPDLTIAGNWYPVKSGESLWPLWLSAGITNDYNGSLTYEWEIYEEGTWNRSKPLVKGLKGNKYVEVNIPNKGSKHRIYLYATDSKGNVITASRPLLIERE